MHVLVTFLEREGRKTAEKGGGREKGRSTMKGLICTRIWAGRRFPHYLTELSQLWMLGAGGYTLTLCQKALRQVRVCIYRHLWERPSPLPLEGRKLWSARCARLLHPSVKRMRCLGLVPERWWSLIFPVPDLCQHCRGSRLCSWEKNTPSLPSWAEPSLELLLLQHLFHYYCILPIS